MKTVFKGTPIYWGVGNKIPNLPQGFVAHQRKRRVVIVLQNGKRKFIICKNPARLIPQMNLPKSKGVRRCDFDNPILL